jgi:uncharacterized protein YecT (DUF1311 family)
MKRILLALLLACPALLNVAHAQKRNAKDPCDDPQSQAEMNMCAAEKFKAADAELNRVYKRLVSLLADNEGQSGKLKAAETAWLKYRDDNCEYEASFFDGGSMRPLILSSCFERMTKARAAELRGQIKEMNQ